MSSQKTTNYDLNQWLPDDSVLRTDFNADNAKIDAALAAMSEQVVQKANQSALDTLITAVNQKAGQADLTALSQTHASDVSQLRAENCWVKLGETAAAQESALISVALTAPSGRQVQEILLCCNAVGGAEAEGAYIQVNGLTGESYSTLSGDLSTRIEVILGSWEQTVCRLKLFPLGAGGVVFTEHSSILKSGTRFYTNTGTRVIPAVSLSGLSSIQFGATSGTVAAGTALLVYGLLK